MDTEFRSHLRTALDEFLRDVHATNATLPIRGTDAAGAFPDANYGSLIRRESLVVVPDSNILLQDIADACLRHKRLALITAANTGAIRLICAEHVIDEVSAHAAGHALVAGVEPVEYLRRWKDEYLPLLRVVPNGAVPESIFTPYELGRVRRLNASKDTPSVRLAMALGAFYLTKDEAPWQAVYDTLADKKTLLDWLVPVRGGNTADELSKVGCAAMIAPALAFEAVHKLYGVICQRGPLAFVPIVAAFAYGAYMIPRARYKDALTGIGHAAEVFAACRSRYEEAMDRFAAMSPQVPSWDELADATPRRALLHRACLIALARSPYTYRSAVELAGMLPGLGVGQSSPLVRETLRLSGCFVEPYRGRWQVGRAHSRFATSLIARPASDHQSVRASKRNMRLVRALPRAER